MHNDNNLHRSLSPAPVRLAVAGASTARDRRTGTRWAWGILLAALALLATLTVAPPAEARAAVTRSTSDVAWFADPETRVGGSHLIRTPWGVLATFRTSGLMPREALTLWWVVFNNPAGCSDPCGEDDIFVDGNPANGLNAAGIEAADIVAGYATGKVANRKGAAFMVAFVAEGGPVSEIIFGEGPLLKDSDGAEIHLVARSHGPAVRGLIAEQTGSYAGGCDVFLLPPAIPTEAGECADIQFTIHLP